MTKTVLAVLAALMIPISVSAQTDPTAPPPPPATTPTTAPVGFGGAQMIGGDFLISLPVGDMSNGATFGIGALFRYERNLIPQLNLTGRAGLIYYLPKNDANFMTIPVLAGIKYDITPEIYAAAELGIFHNRVSVDTPIGNISASETDFGITLGGGYRLGIIDVRLGLHILDLGNAGDFMSINAGIGYNFWNG